MGLNEFRIVGARQGTVRSRSSPEVAMLTWPADRIASGAACRTPRTRTLALFSRDRFLMVSHCSRLGVHNTESSSRSCATAMANRFAVPVSQRTSPDLCQPSQMSLSYGRLFCLRALLSPRNPQRIPVTCFPSNGFPSPERNRGIAESPLQPSPASATNPLLPRPLCHRAAGNGTMP